MSILKPTSEEIRNGLDKSYEIPNKVQDSIPAPLVSVYVTTYQHVSFIKDCLDSILMQKTSFPFEFIVGEDFSTDGTREIVNEYAEQYPEIIRLITAGDNVGQAANSIRCLLACRGKYIALCDGDDYWTDPLKLEKQAEFMEANPGYSLCYHSHKRKFPDELSGLMPVHPKDYTADELIATPAGISVNSKFIRNVFKKADPEIVYKVYNDFMMTAFLGCHGNCKYLPDIGPSIYRIHSGGAYSSSDQKLHITIMAKINVYQFFLWQQDEHRAIIALKALKDKLEMKSPLIEKRKRYFRLSASQLKIFYKGIKFDFFYAPVTKKMKSIIKKIFLQNDGNKSQL